MAHGVNNQTSGGYKVLKIHGSFIDMPGGRPGRTGAAALLALMALIGFVVATAIWAVDAASADHSDLRLQRHPVAGHMTSEQDATLESLSVNTGGEQVAALAPQFDPATTLYTATVEAESVVVTGAATAAGAGIDRTSVIDQTVDLDPPASDTSTLVNLTEGATTVVSMRVRAADKVTTETYYIILSRPADPSVPDITIEADPSEYVAGIGPLTFTLTREGDTADSLDVSVNLIQTQEWLSTLSETATFAAGDSETSIGLLSTKFSTSVTRSGNLAATVAPVAGYDTSGAAPVRVSPQEGPAITVALEHSAYTVAEDAGTLDVVVVARARAGVTSVDDFIVSILSDPQTAVVDMESPDYEPVRRQLRFTSSDFQVENGALVGRKTVSITILEDDVIEGDELFHLHLGRSPALASNVVLLDPKGNECDTTCPNPYVVAITDNDPSVTVNFALNSYTVVEGGSQDLVVTLSDDPQRTVEIPITITDQGRATGADYSGVPRALTFKAGETSRTITFTATFDTNNDDGESVKLYFGSMLPPGVTQGPVNETIVTITNRKLMADEERPGISIPECGSSGVFIFWHAAVEFDGDPPPHGWRVERRGLSDGEWITDRFDFLGAASVALQTHSDDYWDWTDRTRRRGVEYTYRVHALDDDAQLLDGRNWSRRAQTLCQ